MEEPAPPCLDGLSSVEQIGSPISSSTGAMGSILRKLDELRPSDKTSLQEQKRIEDVFQELKGDLEKTSSFLLDLCAMEEPNLTVKYWMEEARVLSYDVEDYLDTLMLSANIHGARKAGEDDHKGRAYLTKHSKTVHHRISEFRARVQETNERHKSFMLGRCVVSSPRNEQPARDLPVVNSVAAELIGLDTPVDEIVQWLKDNESQQLRVVSIVGCGGLGKTALATKLYASTGWQFEHKAFVRVSRKPDLRRLLTNVLSQVRQQQEQQTDACEVQMLLDNLRKHLQDKRYFIIFDEIWTITAWDILTRAFPDGNNGSIIITTTHIENVAYACCSHRTGYVYQMKHLSDEHSRKLFFSGVFGSEGKCPDEEFKEVSYEITRKCGGLPLAIIIIAGILACQAISKQWKQVQNSLPYELGTNHNSKEMRQLLNLNFIDLPHHLKTCLLYLNIYPEDFTVLKDDLVQQWIAEGFIGKDKGKDSDEIARRYFDELVKRRMIQPVDVSYSGEVLSCTIHHMVHDFIAEKSLEQNFITVIDYSQTITGLPSKVHRLCIHFGSAKYATPPAGIRQSQVRSLAFFGFMKCMPSIMDFKVLRVLILEMWGDDKSSCFDLSGVAALLHLRYLKVSCNVKVVMPAQMQNLKCLATLEIDAHVTSVPSDIAHLPNLAHLSLPGEALLLHGTKNMRSLLTSPYFDISKKSADMDQRLRGFANLHSLRLNWSSARYFNLEGNIVMDRFFSGLGNLRSLIVSARSNQKKMKHFWVELHMESPPPLLERLEFVTPISIFSKFPKWIGQLKMLSVLRIMVEEINIDTLGALSCLTILSLYLWRAPEGRIILNSTAFPVLNNFEFICTVHCLQFEKGAMPNLRRLKVAFNARGRALYPHRDVGSIRHLVNLEELSADIGTVQARESDRSAAEAALKNAISKHPGCPAVNINWVSSFFGGDEDLDTSTQQSKHWIQEEELGSAGELLEEFQGMVDEDYMESELKVPSMKQKREPEKDLEQQHEIIEIDAKQDLEVAQTELRRSNVVTEIEMVQEPTISEKDRKIGEISGESLGVTTEVPKKHHSFLDGAWKKLKVPQTDWEQQYGKLPKQSKDTLQRFGSQHQEFGIGEGKFEEEYAMGTEANYGSNQSPGRPAVSWSGLQMETALGTANWHLAKVLKKLSDDPVAWYVASRELGLNYEKITDKLNHTLGLLHAAQGRDVGDNSGLQGLLDDLCKKADEAEDALDELHYFMIQDKLDGTREVTCGVRHVRKKNGTQEATLVLGHGLRAQARHARRAPRNTASNWLSCFSCFRSQDGAVPAFVTDTTHNTSKAKSDNRIDGGQCDDKLPFDQVAMSNKIKQLLEDMHSECSVISDLLKIIASSSLQPGMPTSTKQSDTRSEIIQQRLFGRVAIFEKTMNKMINAAQIGEILSVLPIVGPGGIGKTTFTQHLYNDKRTEEHFTVRAWVCVSTNFDVLKLTKQILCCIPADENEGANETNNLDQLQKSITKRLRSKRFLIVLDDIWQCSEDKWANLLAPFKMREAGTGSMIIVTTRFPYIAQMVKTTTLVSLEGLEPAEFWIFFQACVFDEVTVEHDKELIEVARKIADKLKCSPLAAKTVGQLLKKRFSREHWVQILENKEWLNQTHDDDIMPALKISYDYLPFHLKKCFSYCALYPEDYKFQSLEISRFWISIGIIDSGGQNDKMEDIGSKYLDELFDYGFLMKGDDNYYVIHDLLHDLAQMVSSKECARISCSSFRAENIPSSIRHLSILMQNKYIENFGGEMDKLKRRIDIGNLRSLMIFGEYRRASLVNILKDTFKEIKGLRVLFIFMNSLNSLPHNFSKLIHLRYLKLKSPRYSEVSLPSTVSRFYHLKFLDLQDWRSNCDLPKGINRLVNLCHFVVANKELHSNIPEVGKMKLLQELRIFHVKKQTVGFELGELGQLEKIGGELDIYGLENVRTRKKGNEVKLMKKRNLTKLALVWSGGQPSVEDDILDGLKPHSNLRALSIVNHGGVTGPTWLCSNTHLKNLETLHLEGVSWSALPPFGLIHHLRTLELKNIVGICQFGPDFIGGITERSFAQLKEVEFADMPELVEWVGGANRHLFSRLEKTRCTNCPKLTALPFSMFPNLCDLYTDACPKLCLPPLPHTSKLSSFRTDYFYYYNDSSHLSIKEMHCELALHNLGEVERLTIKDASLISFMDLQKLHPLRSIKVQRCDEAFLRALEGGIVLQSVQSLQLEKFHVTGKSLTSLFRCFPSLSYLDLIASDESHDEEEEEVLLQFPPYSSLRCVQLHRCKNLILPVVDGSGFQGLLSLESVSIHSCGKLLSGWSTGAADCSSINPFPPCVKDLRLWNDPSTLSMALLSNLTSLTRLELGNCKNVTVDGFDPLITCKLEHLSVYNWKEDGETVPYSISVAGDLLAEVSRTKIVPAGSFQLVILEVDCISAVLVAPICTRLSATLWSLWFIRDWRAESFTEEQCQALQLLTSLEVLGIDDCRALQSLPQGLHHLSSLELLRIYGSHRIRSLPKEGLPDSLQDLSISNCCPQLYKECQQLRGTRPDINVDANLQIRTTNED